LVVLERVVTLLDGKCDVRDATSLAHLCKLYARRFHAPLADDVGRPIDFLRRYRTVLNIAYVVIVVVVRRVANILIRKLFACVVREHEALQTFG
jgi:hypothetical protein